MGESGSAGGTRHGDVTIGHVKNDALVAEKVNGELRTGKQKKTVGYFVCCSSSIGSHSDPRLASTDGMGHRSEFSRQKNNKLSDPVSLDDDLPMAAQSHINTHLPETEALGRGPGPNALPCMEWYRAPPHFNYPMPTKPFPAAFANTKHP